MDYIIVKKPFRKYSEKEGNDVLEYDIKGQLKMGDFKNKMIKQKHCANCKYNKLSYNTNYKCIPCKRGKYVRDNWRKCDKVKPKSSNN